MMLAFVPFMGLALFVTGIIQHHACGGMSGQGLLPLGP